MKNMPLSIFVVIAGFLAITIGAQEPAIEASPTVLTNNEIVHTYAQKPGLTAPIYISEEDIAKLERLTSPDRAWAELSNNDKLRVLSQMRARNTPAYLARKEKREELTAVYNDMQMHQGLCIQPMQLLKHLLHNDYDSLARESWDKIYHCHMARKSFRKYQKKSRQEKKLHAEVLSTPEYNAMKQRKLIIDLPESEQK